MPQRGREWHPNGQPEAVKVHDFPDKQLGKAIPYGVYALTANADWVSVGVDHDTSEFAVEALRRWWRKMGRRAYLGAGQLLITCDGGGANSSRGRLWKVELQGLADELGLQISMIRHITANHPEVLGGPCADRPKSRRRARAPDW